MRLKLKTRQKKASFHSHFQIPTKRNAQPTSYLTLDRETHKWMKDGTGGQSEEADETNKEQGATTKQGEKSPTKLVGESGKCDYDNWCVGEE